MARLTGILRRSGPGRGSGRLSAGDPAFQVTTHFLPCDSFTRGDDLRPALLPEDMERVPTSGVHHAFSADT